MRVLLKYFRQHPWQRRALTASVAALLGVLGAWVAWPTFRDLHVAALLGSHDPLRRQRGIVRAVELGKDRPALVERLAGRLDSAGDMEFSAIAEVLRQLGLFHAPDRPGRQIDRWRAINLSSARGLGSAGVRLLMLNGIILDGRDNDHVRRALRRAAGDEAAEVRAASAVLAARLGDDAALTTLLADGQAQVRAAAAVDAALAGRKACVGKIAGMFDRADGDEEISAAAYALASLDGEEFAAALAERIRKAHADGSGALLERLLYVGTLSEKHAVAPAMVEVLARAKSRESLPPAMALVAAGRLRLEAARPFAYQAISAVLRRDESKLTMGDARTLAAAVKAAHRFGRMPKLFAVCMEKLWHPGTSQAMIFCAEALGDLPSMPASPAAPEELALTREAAMEVLRRAAGYEGTPVPSAAAAVALFRLAPDRADEALRAACESETWLAGDYVAWHLARAGPHRQQAMRVAADFLAPGVYNKGVQTAGAMLLAMLARRTDQAGAAAGAIEARLAAERDPFVAGSCRCALLILGRRRHADEVAELARSDTFPKRRALTALLLAGEPAGLDLLLGGERLDAGRIDSFLSGRLMARVCAAVAPELPAFDMDAPPDVRRWQCRILRDFYLIHRRSILAKMRG